MKIDIDQDDFGTLCICAIRYCMGRQTYMPSRVRGIVRQHLAELSDRDIGILLDSSKNQWCFGDERIDKPGWLEWRKLLEEEVKRRCQE